MAHYDKKPLNDKASNEFLESVGFVLHPSCNGSEWHGHGQFFVLKVETVITSLKQLIEHFKTESYVLAYNLGKNDALSSLYEKMNAIVFPPPEVNYNKLTVE